jgi:hypothetical protein
MVKEHSLVIKKENNMFRYNRQNYIITPYTLSLRNTWYKMTTALPTRDNISIMNEGLNSDLSTNTTLSVYITDELNSAPTTEEGILLKTGDVLDAEVGKTLEVYVKTNTTNNTIKYIEYNVIP